MAFMPLLASADGQTTRIEIARGKHPFVTLAEPEGARQFTVWSGPGTATAHSPVLAESPDAPTDFADWAGGTVTPPGNLTVFKVRFFCAADAPTPREAATSHQCYGVYYGIDPQTREGFIRIPPADDRRFPDNLRSIHRGVEGNWYRASGRWEAVVRPRIEAALASSQQDIYHGWEHPPVYTAPPASHTAVGAAPKVTPKK